MLKSLLVLLALQSLCCGASVEWHQSSTKEQNEVVDRDTDSGRVVGGRTASIAMHPHQVSLRTKLANCRTCIHEHICGGSIISQNTVLTAAHCVIGRLASEYHIVAGDSQRTGSDGAVVPVREIIMHENFKLITFTNDIAILKLAAPLPLNNFTIKAIEMADATVKEGDIATVTGWGNTGIERESDILQEVKVPVISNELCNKDYNPRYFVSEDMLCAGFRGVGGKDACQGDSGGPLVINGKLAGVVSWGVGCASAEYPGVYSRISYHLPWLLENTLLSY